MLIPAALVLRSADGAIPIVGGIVLAMWGIGGVAYGLNEILHLRR